MDRIPNIEPLLSDLESYILTEGLMVMKANSDTIISVSVYLNNLFILKNW